MNDYSKISVSRKKNKKLIIKNPTSYSKIGAGTQGAVFKISDQRCVKVFARSHQATLEYTAYQSAQGSPIMPKLYDGGKNYVVIEYIKGPTLLDYLRIHRRMSTSLVTKLAAMFREMKRVGFTRMDLSLRHIIITPDETLKVIDHVNSYRSKETRPLKLIRKLKQLGLLREFKRKLKTVDNGLYEEWKTLMGK